MPPGRFPSRCSNIANLVVGCFRVNNLISEHEPCDSFTDKLHKEPLAFLLFPLIAMIGTVPAGPTPKTHSIPFKKWLFRSDGNVTHNTRMMSQPPPLSFSAGRLGHWGPSPYAFVFSMSMPLGRMGFRLVPQ